MQIDRQALLLFILVFIFLSLPNNSDQPTSLEGKEALDIYKDALREEQKELENGKYYYGYGNLTGFKLSYQDNILGRNILEWPFRKYSEKDPWIEEEKNSILPNSISELVRKNWGTEKVDEKNSKAKAYMLNISGHARGEVSSGAHLTFKKYNLPLPKYLEEYHYSNRKDETNRYQQDPENNIPPANPDDIDRTGNITGNVGKVMLNIHSLDYNYRNPMLSRNIASNDSVDDVVLVDMSLWLSDEDEKNLGDLPTIGLYFQNIGALVAVTTSSKFAGLSALPHLVIHEELFEKSKLLVRQYMNVTDIDNEVTMRNMESDLTNALKQCEYISYFQFVKSEHLHDELRAIDEELMNPSGRPILTPVPKLEIASATMFSPDCGKAFQLKDERPLIGDKKEVITLKYKSVFAVLLLLILVQLSLYIRLIKKVKTPGELSKISISSLVLIAFQDNSIQLVFFLGSTSFLRNLFFLAATIAVILFIMFGFFEGQLIKDVSKIQANERDTTWWEILRGSMETREDTSSNDTRSEQNQDNQPHQEHPVSVLNEEGRISNSTTILAIFSSVIMVFLFFFTATLRARYRRNLEFLGFILFNSYWWPQFFRNTLKNKRLALTWEFILTTSLVRLIPIWYVCLDRKNPFYHHRDETMATVVTLWIFFQLALLFLQYFIGPRFWIKESWLPKSYNYHAPLSLLELENGFSNDIFSQLNSQNENLNLSKSPVVNCKIDCAICMNQVEVPVAVDTKIGLKSLRDSRKTLSYMFTPCRHVFHTECLEDWMKYKLQCPVCRNGLPPL